MAQQDNTGSCQVPSWMTEPAQQELSAILKNLKQDLSLMDCMSLGKDGVMRSLTADREVIDAAGLRPDLITAFRK
jgi:hypothetical protein